MLVGSDVSHGLKRTGVCLILLLGVGVIPLSWAGEDEKTLSLSLAANKTVYSRGEQVEITLTVTNTAKHPVTLSFASSKQYDFVIIQGDHVIRRWSDGKMFAMVLTIEILGPQETKRYQMFWDQTDRTGRLVQPGSYKVAGMLEMRSSPTSESTSFEIR